jgi:hypothetical protein
VPQPLNTAPIHAARYRGVGRLPGPARCCFRLPATGSRAGAGLSLSARRSSRRRDALAVACASTRQRTPSRVLPPRRCRDSSKAIAGVAARRTIAYASIHQLVERVEDDNGPAVVTRALHRSPRPSGRSSRFHGSARIEKARSACLPSFDHGASQGRRAAMIRRCP